MRRSKFPVVAVILLIIGILWLISELGIAVIKIPWWPVILIVVAVGWIVNRLARN